MATLCQTKPKASTKPQLRIAHLEWLLYAKSSPKPAQNHNTRTQRENLLCHCSHQQLTSQQAAAEAYCTTRDDPPYVGAGPSRVLTLRTLQSPLFRTNTGYVLFDVLCSGHLGLQPRPYHSATTTSNSYLAL